MEKENEEFIEVCAICKIEKEDYKIFPMMSFLTPSCKVYRICKDCALTKLKITEKEWKSGKISRTFRLNREISKI